MRYAERSKLKSLGLLEEVKPNVMISTVILYCKYCESGVLKKAGMRHRSQQYRCESCSKYQKEFYKYNAYNVDNETIKSFVKEGVGIRSTGRLLNISVPTVINRIKKIAKDLTPDPNFKENGNYEVDELRTFVKKKPKKSGSAQPIVGKPKK